MEITPQLAGLLAEQDGLVHRDQLHEHGVSDGAIRWAVGRDWTVVLPNVFATFTGRLDSRQRLVAGTLYAGPDAALAAASAARYYGLNGLSRADDLQFLVPSSRAARRSGPVTVRRTDRVDEHVRDRAPLRVCSPWRAVADAVRDLRSQSDASALLVEAVQRGVVSVQSLRTELECGPVRWSRLLREGLRVVESGVWSLPENDLAKTLAGSAAIPEMWTNAELYAADGSRLPTPDGWIDEVGLAVQVHSVRWHAMSTDWEGTVLRDGVFAEYAVPVVAFTPRRIATQPQWVVERVERVVAALRARPRPLVTATPRIALLATL